MDQPKYVPTLTAELDCQTSPNRLSEIWEDYRKPIRLSLPELLFSVEGMRVTIRFHPQHGPLGGIESIKTQFQIALHRQPAFANCKIHWVE